MPTFRTDGPYNIYETRRSPELPGLYVWYGRFHAGEADWDAAYAGGDHPASQRLLRAIRDHAMKFGRQEMGVRADANFSAVWTGTLKEASWSRWGAEPDTPTASFEAILGPAIRTNPSRTALMDLLNQAFPLFYSPLYLGKARDQTLRSRLGQHANRFLDLWSRCGRDEGFVERLGRPKDFAERAIKLGFCPDDLCYITLSVDAEESPQDGANVGVLIDAAEWLLNRWTTPTLGRK